MNARRLISVLFYHFKSHPRRQWWNYEPQQAAATVMFQRFRGCLIWSDFLWVGVCSVHLNLHLKSHAHSSKGRVAEKSILKERCTDDKSGSDVAEMLRAGYCLVPFENLLT